MPRRAARSALALPFILAATVAAPSPASAAFDADGFTFQEFAGANRMQAPAADQTADGGFVVANPVEAEMPERRDAGGRDLVITKLDAQGDPVTTWGTGGAVTIAGHADSVSAVRVLADGTIALWSWRGGWLLRLAADGTVLSDTALDLDGADLQDGVLEDDGTLHTFSVDWETDATVITTYGAGKPSSVTVEDFLASTGTVDSEGRFVLVAMPERGTHQVIRVAADGARDGAFVTPGVPAGSWNVVVTIDGKDRPVVQPDDSWSGAPWRFYRFDATTGALDDTFGGDGEVKVEDADLGPAAGADWGFVAVQDDGKILASGLAGEAHTGNGRALLRITEDGTPDATFDESATGAADGDGIVIVDRARTSFESSAPTPVDGGVIFAFAGWRAAERSLDGAPAGTFTGLFAKLGPKTGPGTGGPGTGGPGTGGPGTGGPGTGGPGTGGPGTGDPGTGDPGTGGPGAGGSGTGSETPGGGDQQRASSSTGTAVTVTAQSQQKTLRSCVSRRNFTIRLRPKALRSATVKVAGKSVKVTSKNGRLTATVDLRKLKQDTFEVHVVAKDAKGRTVRETRAYRTCRVGKNGRAVKGGSVITVVQG